MNFPWLTSLWLVFKTLPVPELGTASLETLHLTTLFLGEGKAGISEGATMETTHSFRKASALLNPGQDPGERKAWPKTSGGNQLPDLEYVPYPHPTPHHKSYFPSSSFVSSAALAFNRRGLTHVRGSHSDLWLCPSLWGQALSKLHLLP